MKLQYASALAAAALFHSFAATAPAAPTSVSIDFPTLRCMQECTLELGAKDHAFALVNGVAGGKEFQARYPQGGKTWEVVHKRPAFEKQPITLWSGALNDGEFALVTVSIFQGFGKDEALLKTYQDSIIAAEKAAPGYEKKTLTADEFNSLSTDPSLKVYAPSDLLNNERAVITKIKDLFNREKHTDHYGGLFNVFVWNDGAKIQKRVIPVGLTFGKQKGYGVKIYTELKNTRDNVYVKDDSGDYRPVRLEPLDEDETTLSVKMLETEVVTGKDGIPTNKITDYLADVTVTVSGKITGWRLEDAFITPDPDNDKLHKYWEFAD